MAALLLAGCQASETDRIYIDSTRATSASGGGPVGPRTGNESASESSGRRPWAACGTIGPDGSSLTQAFEDPSGRFATDPVWAPDGSQIMFSLAPGNDAFLHPDSYIFAINADGSDPTLVIGASGPEGIVDWWRSCPL